MSNPIEDFLLEKTGAGSLADRARGAVTSGLMGAASTALSAGAVAAGTAAAAKIYDAITKRHDFRNMMDYNQDLAEAHATNPKRFNQLYSTLRTFNPDFARDPIVAGTYMRQMVESPMGAGGVAAEAMRSRAKPSLAMEAVLKGGIEGARHGVVEGMKSPPEPRLIPGSPHGRRFE